MVYVSIKGLYITFKLAPDLKKNHTYRVKGYPSILKNSMLQTYNSDTDLHIILL